MTKAEAFTLAETLRAKIEEARTDRLEQQVMVDSLKRQLAMGFGSTSGWTWVRDRRGAQHLHGKRPAWGRRDVPPHTDLGPLSGRIWA